MYSKKGLRIPISVRDTQENFTEFFENWISHAEVEGVVNPDTESYYHYFLSGEIYRDCCYQCPYAQRQRVGDITVGDYWGVQKYDPQLLVEQGGNDQ